MSLMETGKDIWCNMLCYKDKTFCPFYELCAHGDNCEDALTPLVQAKADMWWGKGENQAPIAQFIEEPDCFLPKTKCQACGCHCKDDWRNNNEKSDS